MTILRKMPKRGFRHPTKTVYSIVNVEQLAKLPAESVIDPKTLKEAELVKGARPVKILGGGELTHPLTVSAHAFSASARQKIEAAGGKTQVIQ